MFRRASIEIPYPIEVHYEETPTAARTNAAANGGPVRGVHRLVGPLTDAERARLVAASAERLYRAGEAIVRQGDTGDSMFVICRGGARVTVSPGGQEVARFGPGGYFGEMSLLTGQPRTATVSAIDDCLLLEISARRTSGRLRSRNRGCWSW